MGQRHEAAATAFARRVEAAGLPAVDRILLFGSVARSEEREDSDVDVLAILNDPVDARDVEERLRDLAYDVVLEHDVAISVHAMAASRLETRGDHPFVETVLGEGRPIDG